MINKKPYTIRPNEAYDELELIFDDYEMYSDEPVVNAYEFIREVFELAFGEDAINKGFEPEEVLDKLREFSDAALEGENDESSPAMWS